VKELVIEDGETVVPGLQDKYRCVRARNGDNLLCPFQYYLCHFWNIKKRDRSCHDLLENNLLRGIRRANIDVFWARRPGTVSRNLSMMLRVVRVHTNIHGIELGTMFRPKGPQPVEDTFGVMMGVALLDHSLNTGTNKDHVKFKTIHKTRSDISNFERTGASEVAHPSLAGYKLGERMNVTNTSRYSLWFDRFSFGCHSWMGDDVRPVRAMSVELLFEIQREVECDLKLCLSLEIMLAVCLQGTFF
jgi:hypothetical protein